MPASLTCLRDPGPAPGLTLAQCRAAGCRHIECQRPPAAHERLGPSVPPAAGTARRLQALAFLGHSTPALAGRLAVAERVIRRIQRGKPAQVPADLAAAVSALYDALWDVRGGSHAAARMAARRGWCPPLAWDDDDEDGHGIDDPAAVPADWKPRRRTSSLAARVEDLAEVMADGYTLQQAAWRLGVPRGTVDTLRSRAVRAVAS
jgi:hypothetical protein